MIKDGSLGKYNNPGQSMYPTTQIPRQNLTELQREMENTQS